MSKGGSTCNRLKFIRKRLAEQNGIEYKVERCPNSDNCKEGTCPFCEKEADDLMAVLLEKEKRGEKVIWDVSLDEYDPNVLYGDAEYDDSTIPLIDIESSTVEEIKLRPTMMGRLIDVKDNPLFVKPDKELQLQGFVPNPYKGFDCPDLNTVDTPWFDNENDFNNEIQDSLISSAKPIKDVLPDMDYSEPLREPMMGDIYVPEDMNQIEYLNIGTNTDAEFMYVDNSDFMMVSTDPRDLDDDNFDDTLRALHNIHQSTGSTFTDTLNAYLREGKSEDKAIQYLIDYGGYEKRTIEQNENPEEIAENAESRDVHDESVESNDNPITVEAIKAVRKATHKGLYYCKKMLQKYGGNVEKAIEEIEKEPDQRPLMGRV